MEIILKITLTQVFNFFGWKKIFPKQGHTILIKWFCVTARKRKKAMRLDKDFTSQQNTDNSKLDFFQISIQIIWWSMHKIKFNRRNYSNSITNVFFWTRVFANSPIVIRSISFRTTPKHNSKVNVGTIWVALAVILKWELTIFVLFRSFFYSFSFTSYWIWIR